MSLCLLKQVSCSRYFSDVIVKTDKCFVLMSFFICYKCTFFFSFVFFLVLLEHNIYFTTCQFANAHGGINYCFEKYSIAILGSNSCWWKQTAMMILLDKNKTVCY